jgi:hypothetical protein
MELIGWIDSIRWGSAVGSAKESAGGSAKGSARESAGGSAEGSARGTAGDDWIELDRIGLIYLEWIGLD